MSEPNHIRDERATRDRLRNGGRDDLASVEVLPPQSFGEGMTWCGRRAEAMFLDLDHAVTHLRYSGSTGPCRACLKVAFRVIEKELL